MKVYFLKWAKKKKKHQRYLKTVANKKQFDALKCAIGFGLPIKAK